VTSRALDDATETDATETDARSDDDACDDDDDAYDDDDDDDDRAGDDAVWGGRSVREECVDNADAGRFLSRCSSEKRRRRQRCGGVTERWW